MVWGQTIHAAIIATVINGIGVYNQPDKWPKGVVPYYFDASISSSQKRAFNQAIKEIEDKTNVDFVPIKEDQRHELYDYVHVTKSKQRNISSASIGRTGNGEHDVRLAGTTKATIVHELLHILGLKHEQSRADALKNVRILYDNIPKKKHFNFEPADERVYREYGEYDLKSIMHYSSYDHAVDKSKFAIEVRHAKNDEDKEIANARKMSMGDISTINAIYPKTHADPYVRICGTYGEATFDGTVCSYIDYKNKTHLITKKKGSGYYYIKRDRDDIREALDSLEPGEQICISTTYWEPAKGKSSGVQRAFIRAESIFRKSTGEQIKVAKHGFELATASKQEGQVRNDVGSSSKSGRADKRSRSRKRANGRAH